MSDLPPERIGLAAPFEFVTVFLFGPYEGRDSCLGFFLFLFFLKNRVRLKVWRIVYCCMASMTANNIFRE